MACITAPKALAIAERSSSSAPLLEIQKSAQTGSAPARSHAHIMRHLRMVCSPLRRPPCPCVLARACAYAARLAALIDKRTSTDPVGIAADAATARLDL